MNNVSLFVSNNDSADTISSCYHHQWSTALTEKQVVACVNNKLDYQNYIYDFNIKLGSSVMF